MNRNMEISIFMIQFKKVSVKPGHFCHFSSIVHGKGDIFAKFIDISSVPESSRFLRFYS